MTVHAPAKLPASATAAAGNSLGQFRLTRFEYWTVAQAVPQTEAALPVPNKVAGAA